jgi:hypothetical protein
VLQIPDLDLDIVQSYILIGSRPDLMIQYLPPSHILPVVEIPRPTKPKPVLDIIPISIAGLTNPEDG